MTRLLREDAIVELCVAQAEAYDDYDSYERECCWKEGFKGFSEYDNKELAERYKEVFDTDVEIKQTLLFDIKTGKCLSDCTTGRCYALYSIGYDDNLRWVATDIEDVMVALEKFDVDIDPDVLNDILQNKHAKDYIHKEDRNYTLYDIASLIGYANLEEEAYWQCQLQNFVVSTGNVEFEIV